MSRGSARVPRAKALKTSRASSAGRANQDLRDVCEKNVLTNGRSAVLSHCGHAAFALSCSLMERVMLTSRRQLSLGSKSYPGNPGYSSKSKSPATVRSEPTPWERQRACGARTRAAALVGCRGPQPLAGEQVAGLLLRDPDLNPCFLSATRIPNHSRRLRAPTTPSIARNLNLERRAGVRGRGVPS